MLPDILTIHEIQLLNVLGERYRVRTKETEKSFSSVVVREDDVAEEVSARSDCPSTSYETEARETVRIIGAAVYEEIEYLLREGRCEWHAVQSWSEALGPCQGF